MDVSATTTNKTYLLASYDKDLSTGTEQQIRVNGTFSQRGADTTTAHNTANRIRVGARRDTDSKLDGKIAEVIVWNSRLTTAQQDILEDNTLAYFNL